MIAKNAGLVLLWPFLDTLFHESGLLENNRFKGVEDTAQAIYILNYLAMGVQNYSDQELLVPKILTGWDSDTVISSEIILHEKICNECDKLINDFIRQWSVLRSASPASLRESFLQRSAVIEKKNNRWYFNFEGRGIDILLAHLPFSISIIKLKWLEEPLTISLPGSYL